MENLNSKVASAEGYENSPVLLNKNYRWREKWTAHRLCLKPILNYQPVSWATLIVLLIIYSGIAIAMPFNSFDPRSMAMGGTGVAVGDPSTAPFFNPAMLSASDPEKKYSVEFPIVGGTLYDPSNMHSNLKSVASMNAALTSSRNALNINSTALTNSITTLANNISALTVVDLTSANTAAGTISTLTSNVSSVSSNMSATGSNATVVATEINNINHLLLAMNNQPVQAKFGAATVVGIPGNDWGFAVYADVWGAMGGKLIYNDAGTVSNLGSATATVGAALTESGTATASTLAALTDASNALKTAIASCSAGNILACSIDIPAASAKVDAASSSLASTTNILGSNATKIANATTVINQNPTLQSQVRIRGVLIEETGFSISHNLADGDQSCSIGITPKIMYLHLFDAKLNPDQGSISSGLTSNNYLAEYTTFNFDLGVAKAYDNGMRLGVVVKNVVPQTFDFKNSPPTGGTPVPDGASLTMNPQARIGASYESEWSTIAFDLDVTKNNPAGLENHSQYVGIGGEWSAFGWAQLRAGYHHDLLNPSQPMASAGFGVSPRIPYFKPHFDFAVTVSPNIFANGWGGATQVGAAFRAGLNF
jgi:hypothetical protein